MIMGEIVLKDEEVEEAKGRTAWRRIEAFVFENRWVVAGMLLGLTFFGGGLFLARSGVLEGTKVEVIDESLPRPEGAGVVVEVSGEVMNPGVYKLQENSRVEDLLVVAGGLSANADREWVSKNLNRAARLVDGQKIYIPGVGESVKGTTSSTSTTGSTGSAKSLININTASASELDTLWGIGPARAAAIIEGRPYSSVEELLTRKVIPSNVYERIKDEITAP